MINLNYDYAGLMHLQVLLWV